MSVKNYILILLLIVNSFILFSQDSVKTKPRTDTTYTPVKFILSDLKYSYINPNNPDTVSRKRFLWYNMKNFEDIFNYLPGYYLKYMDVGQVNQLNFNQLNQFNTVLLRNGRSMNDLIDGMIDFNLLSRNEIAELEVSNGFGNNLYKISNSINIIQRQIFQNSPYTEISFIQDRYENFYFDGNFHQNIFRRLNVNFGITKHSYDGHYINSDFDKWLGRFNLNFAASNRLNFFAYFNYAKIQRGLNEGVDPLKVNLGNKDEIFDASLAAVKNSDSYEKKEKFDVDAGAIFLTGKSSFSKLQFFVSNSFREYRDEENRPIPNNIFIMANYHWINYGIKLQQVFNFNFWNNANLMLRSQGQFEHHIVQRNVSNADTTNIFWSNVNSSNNIICLMQEAVFLYKGFSIEGYVKSVTKDTLLNRFVASYGLKATQNLKRDSLFSVKLSVFYNMLRKYTGAGIDFESNPVKLYSGFYIFNLTDNYYVTGINNSVNLKFFNFYIDVLLSYNFKRDTFKETYPKIHGTANISYRNIAFKNKLEYKIGLSSRFWSKHSATAFLGLDNNFTYYDYKGLYPLIDIPQNATLDFYIMGKIGRATFGLTFENILNRIVYNTGVYPYMDRGGLGNVLSRFNITWNFFN